MAGIIVLRGEELAASFHEGGDREVEARTLVQLAAALADVNIDGQTVLVCTLPWRGGTRPSLQVALIEAALLLHGAAATIQSHANAVRLGAGNALDHHWAKGVVQS